MKFKPHYIEGGKGNRWKGGKSKFSRGYIGLYIPSHPRSGKRGYVYEHRVVMENHLGRYLSNKEVVHHINGILDDNRIENLILLKSQSEHRKEHRKYRNYNENDFPKPNILGDIITINKHKSKRYQVRECIKCKLKFWFDLENNGIGYCNRNCSNERKFSRKKKS